MLKKIQILTGISLCIALILSIILPVIMLTIDPYWLPIISGE
jgi:hypothetical protein